MTKNYWFMLTWHNDYVGMKNGKNKKYYYNEKINK